MRQGSGLRTRTLTAAAVCVSVGAGALYLRSIVGHGQQPPAKTAAPTTVGFTPEPLPNPGIPGFQFPTPEATILQWTASNNRAEISRHGWGLWTALTAETNQIFGGQKLRVFETWPTPEDITAGAAARPLDPRPLRPLRQLASPRRLALLAATPGGTDTVTGFVKYDPTASGHIVKEHLLTRAHLADLLKQHQTSVPAFDAGAISLKAQFQHLDRGRLAQDRYFPLPTWPGPPNPPAAFDRSQWHQCVWIDIQDTAPSTHGAGAVDTVCKRDGTSRTAANTYGVGQFVNFKMNAAQARTFNLARIGAMAPAAPDDYTVLVGMHVTTREIERWTWQTFWWTPNTVNPPSPSSAQIASARPSQLQGPARNYAHCTSYSTEYPPQPNTGGQNVGESVYCYNPYLEAPFGPGDLPLSRPGVSQGAPVQNSVGVQTNCMSCHAFANYPDQPEQAYYTGDRYVDLNDPKFSNTLKVDFLWSLPELSK
jgi:hypothetical protein